MKTLFITLILMFGVYSNAETKQEIIFKIQTVSSIAGVDPDLAVAIATVESGLNPNVVGALGEVGLFQLRPEYHRVFAGNSGHNMLVGVAYLAELKRKYSVKYPDSWFVLYNYGPYHPPKNPKKTAYYRKVFKELNRLRVKRYFAIN